MGACYSKAGHEADATPMDKRPKEKKRSSSLRNGHPPSKRKNPRLIVEDYDSVQKDVSDTVYTEDSHTMHALDIDNLMNKSQQTSLDMLVKDANKNIETFTAYDGCNTESDKLTIGNGKAIPDVISERLQAVDAKVVTSDSGIVVEQGDEVKKDALESSLHDEYSAKFESNLNNAEEEDNAVPVVEEYEDGDKDKAELHSDSQTVHSCSCSNSVLNDSRGSMSHTEHSSSHHEGENRRSVTSTDRMSDTRKSTESTTDLDKIKLAIRQSSVTTLTEQRSVFDAVDEATSSVQQPEVMTMTMNGRDVVVIHAELFSQILDEIQFLKLQLSQLTKVIQDSEDQGPCLD